MKYISLKPGGDYEWDGPAPEFEWRDGQLQSVTFFDGDGNELKVALNGYSCLQALVPEPPKMVKRWKLEGTVIGLNVYEVFDSEYKANEKKDEYAAKTYKQAEDCLLTVTEFECQESLSGFWGEPDKDDLPF